MIKSLLHQQPIQLWIITDKSYKFSLDNPNLFYILKTLTFLLGLLILTGKFIELNELLIQDHLILQSTILIKILYWIISP